MPAVRGTRNSPVLYTVVTLAALFIVATVLAVIFYVKAEGYRKQAADAQKNLAELATDKEIRDIVKIVGPAKQRKSYLGTMTDYCNELASIILGPIDENAPADVKFEKAKSGFDNALASSGAELTDTEAVIQKPGLLRVVEILKLNLDDMKTALVTIDQQVQHTQKLMEQTQAVQKEKEEQIGSQMELLARQAREVQQRFDEMQKQTRNNAEEQIKSLSSRLEKTDQDIKEKQQRLLKVEAELKRSEQKRQFYQDQLDAIKPRPDSNVPAFKADGKVLSVDNRAGIVFIDIGSDDHVYRGLTFSVYDKNMPIPPDGKGKAEIEVFDIEQNVSVARITYKGNQPVVPGDIVANLVWDAEAPNIFVVAGDFDFNHDSMPDADGESRIINLIERWGGKVSKEISVETDFVVLGTPPQILAKPTHEQVEIDPEAMEKYNQSMQKNADYQKIAEQAKVLSVPIFNLDRFLYFIGYKSLAAKSSTL